MPSEYQIAREQLDCLLEISSPKLLRDFFKKYPPAVLPDLFIRINKRELDYLAGVCQLTGEVHYRNWAWLPRNVALATIRMKTSRRESSILARSAANFRDFLTLL